jgi:integrase
MTRPSNNNFNVHKKDLSALFTYAKDILNVVDFNPVLKIKNLPHNRKDRIIPSEECIIKLMLAADPTTDEHDLLTVLLHTLARIDEILRLTWADINFEKRILIKKSYRKCCQKKMLKLNSVLIFEILKPLFPF